VSRLLAVVALASVAAALGVVVSGGGSAPAGTERIVAAPAYPLLDDDAGLPDRAAVRRAVARTEAEMRRQLRDAVRQARRRGRSR